MKKPLKPLLLLTAVIFISSCGYSTRSLLPSHFKKIYVEPFKNKVVYTSEAARNLYLPLLEVKVTNAVVDRFLFDGNLRIGTTDTADLVLKGELLSFDRDALRYFDNSEDVQEYRIRITVSLKLVDNTEDKTLWEEPNFIGETTYFTSGALAKSEAVAVEDALTDLARRIVERTVEDW